MRIVTWFALVGAALVGAGCGGAGGTAALDSGPGGGIGGTGSVAVTAQGPIQGFGSVIVNGVEFDLTPQTVVTVDGAPAGQTDLREGMVVRVTGTYRPGETTPDGRYVPGEAERLEYSSAVRGLAETDPTGTLQVLGRPVRIVASTQIENGIEPGDGDLVEVSGFEEPDGSLRATFVRVVKGAAEFDPDTDEVKVKGVVEGLDVGARMFQVGSQWVRVSEGMSMPQQGEAVEVYGHLEGDVLRADRIELDEESLPEGHEAELAGVVNMVNGTTFTLDGTEVDASGARFEGGTALDLALGVRVEVEGTVENGILVARTVEFGDNGEDD